MVAIAIVIMRSALTLLQQLDAFQIPLHVTKCHIVCVFMCNMYIAMCLYAYMYHEEQQRNI